MTWAAGELERVLGSDALATWNRDRQRGGEWDALAAVPLRTRQRLQGAGYLRLHGLLPDVAADVICANVSGVEGVDAAVRWYVRTALEAIAQERRVRHRVRHLRVARESGDATYYARRVRLAREAGHSGLWAYRQARGWSNERVHRSWRCPLAQEIA